MSSCWSLGLKLSAHSYDKCAFEYFRTYVDSVRDIGFFVISFILNFYFFQSDCDTCAAGQCVLNRSIREAYDTPVKPVSRARNCARSYSVSSSGSSSIPMSRRLPSRRQSPAVPRRPLNPPSASGSSQRSDPEQGSIVSFPQEVNGSAAPRWNRFWNPLFCRFQLSFSLDLSLSRRYLGWPLWKWLTITAVCVLELLLI
jgi:hypothetical protein